MLAERVIVLDALRSYMQARQDEENVKAGESLNAVRQKIDKRTMTRHAEQLIDAGKLIKLTMPNPHAQQEGGDDRHLPAPAEVASPRRARCADRQPRGRGAACRGRGGQVVGLVLPQLPIQARCVQGPVPKAAGAGHYDGTGRVRRPRPRPRQERRARWPPPRPRREHPRVCRHRAATNGGGKHGRDGGAAPDARFSSGRERPLRRRVSLDARRLHARAPLRAQRLHALLVEHSIRAAEATAGGAAAGAAADEAQWPTVQTAELAPAMRAPDYLLLCGLGATPPDASEVLEESRKADRDAIEMRHLSTATRRFFTEDGTQLTKATERLHGLLVLLAELGLIAPTQKSVPARYGAPSAFRVCKTVSHSHWCAGTNLAEAIAEAAEDVGEGGPAAAEEATMRSFDLSVDEEREEYWEALRALCAERLPKRGKNSCAATPAVASEAMHVDQRLPSGYAMALPSEMPEKAQRVLMSLREAQWSSARPLTSHQKHRLARDAPSEMPQSQAEVVAVADSLEVHPLQLLAWIKRVQAEEAAAAARAGPKAKRRRRGEGFEARRAAAPHWRPRRRPPRRRRRRRRRRRTARRHRPIGTAHTLRRGARL